MSQSFDLHKEKKAKIKKILKGLTFSEATKLTFEIRQELEKELIV